MGAPFEFALGFITDETQHILARIAAAVFFGALLCCVCAWKFDKSQARVLHWLQSPEQIIYLPAAERASDWATRAIEPKGRVNEPRPNHSHWALLAWLVEPRATSRSNLRYLMQNPWEWPVFEAALTLSLIYPLLFALAQWNYGATDVKVGNSVLLPRDSTTLLKWAITALLTANLYIRISRKIIKSTSPKSLPFWLTQIAGTLAAAFAVPGALAVAAAFTVSGAVAVTLAAAGGAAVSVAFSLVRTPANLSTISPMDIFLVILIIAFVIAISIALLANLGAERNRGNGRRGYGALAITLIGLAFAATAVGGQDTPRTQAAILLFYTVFPAVNATFDWLSYGLTLSLVRWGIRARNWTIPLLWLLDILAATFLFAGLGATLILVAHGLNLVARFPLYDVGGMLAEMDADWTAHLWAIGMVFSTLVPTLLHLALALTSAFTWAPAWLRSWLAKGMEARDDPPHFAVAVLGVATLWTLYVMVWAAPVVLLGPYALDGFGWVAQHYLVGFTWWAEALEGWLPIPTPGPAPHPAPTFSDT